MLLEGTTAFCNVDFYSKCFILVTADQTKKEHTNKNVSETPDVK